MLPTKVTRVWVDDTHVYAEAEDGRQASYSFAQWPRLASASKEERQRFTLTYGGIHWPELDEDLSFDGMFEDCFPSSIACEDMATYGIMQTPQQV